MLEEYSLTCLLVKPYTADNTPRDRITLQPATLSFVSTARVALKSARGQLCEERAAQENCLLVSDQKITKLILYLRKHILYSKCSILISVFS